MPVVTNIFKVSIPKEFLFGATLASLLLAFSDAMLLDEKLKKSEMWFYGIFFISGILSIIYVPVLLQMFPEMLVTLDPYSADMTLMTLGFVLLIIGYKSVSYKSKALGDIGESVEEAQFNIKYNDEEIKQIKESNHSLTENLKEKTEQLERSKYQVELLEDENSKLRKLSEEDKM